MRGGDFLVRGLLVVCVVVSSLGLHLTKIQDSSNAFSRQRNCPSDRNVTKVLVLGYGRSGSSLVAELVAAADHSAYIFEPMWKKEEWGTARMEKFLNGLFDCQTETMSQLENWFSLEGRNITCDESVVVIKTIRVHARHLIPWIKNSDVKIVHLLRDPRAVLHSREGTKEVLWPEKDALGLCHGMEEDLNLKSILPADRYHRIRYEDVVENPVDTMKETYRFLKIPFDAEVKEKIESHFRYKDDSRGFYYSTYRTDKHDPNKWKTEMKKKTLSRINKKCSSLLKKLKY